MREEIVDLCKKIKNLDQCRTCGGNHKNGVCNFCGKGNQEMIYLSLQLEKKLNNLPKDEFEKVILNYSLNSLYSIKQLEIPAVNKILKDYDYEHTVLETYSYLQRNFIEIIQNNKNLSNEQYDLLLISYLNDEFLGDTELTVANIIVKEIIENNENSFISNDDKEKFFLKMTESIANNVLGFKKSHAKIQDDIFLEKKDSFGSSAYNYVYLSRQTLHDNPGELFTTIFHELIHLKQYKEQKIEHVLSEKNLIEIKDTILSQNLSAYYDENYKNISFEKEAFYYQYKETIDYFNCINIKVSDEIKNQDILNSYRCNDFLTNMERKINGINNDLIELFNQFIINNPKYLLEYPQLCFEYKIENDVVKEKTLEELLEDFNKFQNDELKWNGNKEEINSLYLNKIRQLEENKGINM